MAAGNRKARNGSAGRLTGNAGIGEIRYKGLENGFLKQCLADGEVKGLLLGRTADGGLGQRLFNIM